MAFLQQSPFGKLPRRRFALSQWIGNFGRVRVLTGARKFLQYDPNDTPAGRRFVDCGHRLFQTDPAVKKQNQVSLALGTCISPALFTPGVVLAGAPGICRIF
jgi:hypothetical protein